MAFIKCSGGGKLTESAALWTNESPGSNWGASTDSTTNYKVIPVSDINLSQYQIIKIEFLQTKTAVANITESTPRSLVFFTYDYFITTGNNKNNPKIGVAAAIDASSNRDYTRTIFYNNGNISVGPGNAVNASGRTYDKLVPYKLYGLK